MRPIIVLALIIFIFIGCIFVYNASAPQHDDISGTYVYGGETLTISGGRATYGEFPIYINQIREENVFQLTSNNLQFPSGLYIYSNNNLIGENNGVTFLRR